MGLRYAGRWNAAVKADTSKLDAVAEAANAEVMVEKAVPKVADWVFLIGLSLVVSVVSQQVGSFLGGVMSSIHLDIINSGICTTLFTTFLGLGCAMTPLGKLPAVEELNGIYLYAVISLLASTSSITDLMKAPMWVVYGLFILAVHAAAMFLLSKLFHWDLCMVSTASLANIGGTASAPLIASAYNPSFASIGVLMGVMGSSIGNILGLGMGAILRILV